MAMPDPTIPLIVAAAFVGVGWIIVHAGRQYDDAIHHTLTIFALAIGMLVLIGVTATLRARLGIGRMTHRIEARSQVERPAGTLSGTIQTPGCCGAHRVGHGSRTATDGTVGSSGRSPGSSAAPAIGGGRD